MTFFLKVRSDLVIADALEYEYPGYTEAEVEFLPNDILAGHYRFENGKIVEDASLKVIPFEKEFNDMKEKFLTAEDKYREAAGRNSTVEDLQGLQIAVLKEQCSNAIFAGFTSGEHEFGYNDQDQANFTKRLATIAVGAEGPFEWKTKNNGVVELTKEEFIQVVTDAEAHQLEKQRRYWELEASVLNADTKEDVDAIKW